MTTPIAAPVYSQRAPAAHVLFGHVPAFNRDLLGFLTLLAREYGDLVPLRFTPFRALLVNHPDLIEDVLVTHNRSFVKSLALRRARTLLGNGLIVSEGEFWLRQRRMMQPAFHRQRIAGCGQVMVAYAQEHVADWRSGEVKDSLRKKTPSGPGCDPRCCAAWTSTRRAWPLPALVMGPW